MRKQILAFLLAAALLVTPSLAYTASQQNAADALNSLGLFLGTGTARGYDLDAKLNRNQGVILLVRMLGKEDAALSGEYQHTFTDVPAGASGYVGYAYSQGIVNGYTKTKFGGADTMSDTMFLALALRALGYTDGGDMPDFQYRESRKMAQSLGLVEDAANDSDFTRGDAVEVFWKILQTNLKGQSKTLGGQLVEQKVITEAELSKAADIRKNGKPDTSSGGSHSGGSGGSSSGGSGSGSSGSGNTGTGGKTYTWEEYQALSAEKQWEFMQSFTEPADFFAWQTEAKAAYDQDHPNIDLGQGGRVDLGELIHGGQ